MKEKLIIEEKKKNLTLKEKQLVLIAKHYDEIANVLKHRDDRVDLNKVYRPGDLDTVLALVNEAYENSSKSKRAFRVGKERFKKNLSIRFNIAKLDRANIKSLFSIIEAAYPDLKEMSSNKIVRDYFTYRDTQDGNLAAPAAAPAVAAAAAAPAVAAPAAAPAAAAVAAPAVAAPAAAPAAAAAPVGGGSGSAVRGGSPDLDDVVHGLIPVFSGDKKAKKRALDNAKSSVAQKPRGGEEYSR